MVVCMIVVGRSLPVSQNASPSHTHDGRDLNICSTELGSKCKAHVKQDEIMDPDSKPRRLF